MGVECRLPCTCKVVSALNDPILREVSAHSWRIVYHLRNQRVYIVTLIHKRRLVSTIDLQEPCRVNRRKRLRVDGFSSICAGNTVAMSGDATWAGILSGPVLVKLAGEVGNGMGVGMAEWRQDVGPGHSPVESTP